MPIQNPLSRLQQFWIFEDFDPEDILTRVDNFVQERGYRIGEVLYRQGDSPDWLYLIEEGEIEEVGRDAHGAKVLHRKAQAGDAVGRSALIEDKPRRATAVVTKDARLLLIGAAGFKTLLAMFPVLRERLTRVKTVNRLLAIPVFSCFSEEQLFHIADLVREIDCPTGTVIFQQGGPADAFYVIDTGQVIETVIGMAPGTQTWPKYLSAGSFFGRYALLNNTARRSTATAATDTHLFCLSADSFHWLRKLQPAFAQGLRRPDLLGFLRQIRTFSRWTEDERKQLAGFVGLAHLRAGDTLYRQGEIDPTVYILSEGEAVIRHRDESGRERPQGYLKVGDAVGQTSLFLNEPRDVTVECTAPANWFYLTRQDLDQFLDKLPDARDRLLLSDTVQARRKLQRFSWMEPEEQMVMRRRRHWYYATLRLIPPAALLLASFIALVLPKPPALQALLQLLGWAGLLLAVLGIIWRAIDWINDYYVITTKRVAHREKTLFVRESRDATPLDKVQNANIDRRFVGNLLGFGTLFIDTAAAAGVTRVTFDYLSNPEEAKELVLEQMRRAKAVARLEARRVIRGKLESSMGVGIRPSTPRPAVPAGSAVPAAPSTKKPAQWPKLRLPPILWIERRSDDQVTWRKHWIRLLARTWLPGLIVLGLLILLLFYLLGGREPQPQFVALLLGLLTPFLGWLWWNYTDWANDQYIVTADRIIDTERLPLGFRSRRTETTFDRIQNVNYEVPNPLATILRYGTVMIHTAGTQGRLDFQWVKDPRRVHAEIFGRLTAYQEAQQRQQQEDRWSDLPEWFAAFRDMRRS